MLVGNSTKHTREVMHTVQKNVHRYYFDWLASKLNIDTQDKWYLISQHHLLQKGGKNITSTQHYRDALQNAYPEYTWYPWLFRQLPKNYWNEHTNQRKYFDWLASHLGIDHPEGWYSMTVPQVISFNGHHILKLHSSSLLNALKSVYPHHDWLPWKFGMVSHKFWTHVGNQKKYLDWLASDLSITTSEQWKSVTCSAITSRGGGALVSHFKHSMRDMLQSAYPQFEWTHVESRSDGELQIKKLFQSLDSIKHDLKINYLHPQLVHSTDRNMELDFYIPSLGIALEYHGLQHYKRDHFWGRSKRRKERDIEKRRACESLGITLVEVPYWFDGSMESLLYAIYQHKPEIALSLAAEADVSLPQFISTQSQLQQHRSNRSKLFLPQLWTPDINPTGWWIVERREGVSVLWNGSSFRTRAMRKITPPNNWKEALPPINIEGELWCEDRDMCRRAVLAGRPSVSGWKGLTFIAYDLPDQKQLIFSERIKLLKQLIDKEKYPRALIPNFIECEGEHHLQKLRLDKFNESGSGMLLFNPSHSIEFPQVLYVAQPSIGYAVAIHSHTNQQYFLFQKYVSSDSHFAMLNNFSSLGVSFAAEDRSKISNDIKLGSVVKYSFNGVNPDLTPKCPNIHEHQPTLQWNMMSPYRVSLGIGTSKGPTPTCAGCHKQFTDRNELRVKTQGYAFSAKHELEPRAAVHSFCANIDCIEHAVRQSRSDKVYPPFLYKITVPSSVEVAIDEQHKQLLDRLVSVGRVTLLRNNVHS